MVWEAVKRLGLQGFKELTEYTYALTHEIEKRLVSLIRCCFHHCGGCCGNGLFRDVHVSDGSGHAFIRKFNERVGIVSTIIVAISVALILLNMFLHF